MENKAIRYGLDNIAGWTQIRKRILERDSYQCCICHKDGVEAKLNVHYKEWNREDNEDSNLVTLCSDCHRAIHAEGYKPSEFEDWPVPWGKD